MWAGGTATADLSLKNIFQRRNKLYIALWIRLEEVIERKQQVAKLVESDRTVGRLAH